MNKYRKKSLLLVAIVFLLLLSLILSISISSKQLMIKTLVICSINILNFLILLRYIFGKTFRINLLIVFLIGLFISSLFPQLYLVFRINDVSAIDSWHTSSEYTTVSTFTLIGIIFLIIGYKLKLRENKNFRYIYNYRLKPIDYLNLVIIFYTLAWIARIILFINGAYYFAYKEESFLFGQWYSVLSQISNLGVYSLILLFLVFNEFNKYRRFLIISIILELLWVVPSGARMSIAIIILVIGFYFWYKDKVFPVKKLALIFSIFIISFPTLGLYRYTIGEYSDRSSFDIENSISAIYAANRLIEATDQLKGMNRLDSFISRLYDGNSLGLLLIQYEDDYEWLYGWTVLRGLAGIFVPYFIFPQREINQLTLNEWYPEIQIGGSSPVTFLGEGYINFSYFGFIIMPFLIGILFRRMDLFFQRRSTNVIYSGLYLFLLVNFVFMYSQGIVIMLSTLRMVLIYGLFTFLIFIILYPRIDLVAYKEYLSD